MANPYFRFKKFIVWQQQCAMKVSTLGCVLGAYARHTDPAYVLDVGTGTGLLALMLAQRFDSARIDAVEIDKGAALQAGENVRQSPWARRITVHHTNVMHFESARKYDLIVSNPPFYENQHRAADDRINLARHDTGLTSDGLLYSALRLLSGSGVFFLALPESPMQRFTERAGRKRLYPAQQLVIRSFRHDPPFAVIRGFTRDKGPEAVDHLTIWDTPGRPSAQFRSLLSAFYLQF